MSNCSRTARAAEVGAPQIVAFLRAIALAPYDIVRGINSAVLVVVARQAARRDNLQCDTLWVVNHVERQTVEDWKDFGIKLPADIANVRRQHCKRIAEHGLKSADERNINHAVNARVALDGHRIPLARKNATNLKLKRGGRLLSIVAGDSGRANGMSRRQRAGLIHEVSVETVDVQHAVVKIKHASIGERNRVGVDKPIPEANRTSIDS